MQFETIKELVTAHRVAEKDAMKDESGKEDDTENTREAIESNALEVLVRSGWIAPGNTEDAEYTEFKILLCTGGPAVRIIGTLDEHSQPETANLEYQDWGTPWTEYQLDNDDNTTLLDFARHFNFGY